MNKAGLSKAFIALQLFGLLLYLIVLIHHLKTIPVHRMGFPGKFSVNWAHLDIVSLQAVRLGPQLRSCLTLVHITVIGSVAS